MFSVNDNLAQVGGGSSAGKPSGGGAAVGGGGGPAIGSLPTAIHHPGPTRITIDQLIEAITRLIEPETWSDNGGGPGAIEPIGGALAVRQTPAIQAKVEAFLKELERESGTTRSLTIHAQWLTLNHVQLVGLQGSSETKKTPGSGEAINRAALAALPPETRRYAGQITCFNGQTVHLISGPLRTELQGAIPVVGAVQMSVISRCSSRRMWASCCKSPPRRCQATRA